jgi:predicted Zn-dependent protease
LKRKPIALRSLDLGEVVAPLVRQAIARNDIDGAVSWLKEARSIGDEPTATTLEIWLAEVYARAQRPDRALKTYMRLIKPDAAGAALALDAGEMMLDNGHLEEAKVLLLLAGDTARRNGRLWIERRTSELLDRML